MTEKLSEIFDVAPIEIIHTDGESTIIVPDGDEDEDAAFARAKHYELSQKGSEALNLAMRVARESENPRAIEVLSGLIKNLSEVNKSLLLLNKDKADIKTSRASKGRTINNNEKPSVQQNIIFAGNSRDLSKLISEQLKAAT